MITREHLLEWLEHQSFTQGVKLLINLGEDTSYYKRFAGSYPSAYASDLLFQKIKRLAAEMPDKEAPTSAFITEITPTQPIFYPPNNSKNNEPTAITALREQAKQYHRLDAVTHSEMRNAATKEEKLVCAEKIMLEIKPALDGIYDQIRVYEKTGTLPAILSSPTRTDIDIIKDTVEKCQRLKNLESRLSKIKTLMPTGKPEQVEKWTKEQSEKQAELETLKTELFLNE